MKDNAQNQNGNLTNEERKERRRTWRYVKENDAVKLFLILTVITLGAAALLFLLAILPVAKIEDVSLGNAYYFAKDNLVYLLRDIDFLNFEPKNRAYSKYIFPFTCICLICIVTGIILLTKGIGYLIACLKKKEICINVKHSKKSVVFTVAVIALVYALFLVFLKIWQELYLFDFGILYCLLIVPIVWLVAVVLIKNKYAEKGEHITKEKVSSLTDKNENIEEDGNKVQGTYSFSLVLMLLALVVNIATYNGYSIRSFSYNPVYYSLLGDRITVGEKTPISSMVITEGGITVKTIDLGKEEKKENNSFVWGENLYFYETRIAMLEDEEKELDEKYTKKMENLSEDDDLEDLNELLEKYDAELKKIESKKDVFERAMSNIPAPKESYTMVFETDSKYTITEYVYDTRRTDKDEFKYGEAKTTLLSLGIETAVIEDNVFDIGTDFSEDKAIVTVKYKDGSVKIAMVVPDNVAELNKAGIGTHIFRWSDSWGEYEAEIVIKNKK